MGPAGAGERHVVCMAKLYAMYKLRLILLTLSASLAISCLAATEDEEFDVEGCRTDCEDVQTACQIDCGDNDAECNAECDAALTTCVNRCG